MVCYQYDASFHLSLVPGGSRLLNLHRSDRKFYHETEILPLSSFYLKKELLRVNDWFLLTIVLQPEHLQRNEANWWKFKKKFLNMAIYTSLWEKLHMLMVNHETRGNWKNSPRSAGVSRLWRDGNRKHSSVEISPSKDVDH